MRELSVPFFFALVKIFMFSGFLVGGEERKDPNGNNIELIAVVSPFELNAANPIPTIFPSLLWTKLTSVYGEKTWLSLSDSQRGMILNKEDCDPSGALFIAFLQREPAASPRTAHLTIAANKYLERCDVEVRLESGDGPGRNTGAIWPHLIWKRDALFANVDIDQVAFEITLSIAGAERKITKAVTMESIHTCPYAYLGKDNTVVWLNVAWGSYVTEDDPVVEEIIREAKRLGFLDGVMAFQGDEQRQLKELWAIWAVLQRKGVVYSSLTTGQETDTTRGLFTQRVRLPWESLRAEQANCVDGSVLLASVYRKMGYPVHLVKVPGHMFMSVSTLDAEKKTHEWYIETTMVGAKLNVQHAIFGDKEGEWKSASIKSFYDAAKSGSDTLISEVGKHEDQVLILSVSELRKDGSRSIPRSRVIQGREKE